MTFDLMTQKGWRNTGRYLFPSDKFLRMIPWWRRISSWLRTAIYDTLGRPLCANHGHYLFGPSKILVGDNFLLHKYILCTRCANWIREGGIIIPLRSK